MEMEKEMLEAKFDPKDYSMENAIGAGRRGIKQTLVRKTHVFKERGWFRHAPGAAHVDSQSLDRRRLGEQPRPEPHQCARLVDEHEGP